jgi:hypothetical protein
VIPVVRDQFERRPRLVQPSWFELAQAIMSDFYVAHQARVGEHVQMFRDRLARDLGIGRELHDRHCPARARHGEKSQARLVAELREVWRAIPQRPILLQGMFVASRPTPSARNNPRVVRRPEGAYRRRSK